MAWTMFDVKRLGRNKNRREGNTLSDQAKVKSTKHKNTHKPSKLMPKRPH